MSNALDDLIAAVEAGTWPGADMHDALGTDRRGELAYDAFNGSLDAALALHNAVLPKRYWRIEEWDGAWTAQLPVSTFKRHEATSEASPARAWLLAILRAMKEDA